jgi:hypothetical protein
MQFCEFQPAWYAMAWLPIVIYAAVIILFSQRIRKAVAWQKMSLQIGFCIALFLRCLWLVSFPGCVMPFGAVGGHLLLHLPQLIWINMFSLMMVSWYRRLNSTILGKSMHPYLLQIVSGITVVLDVVVFSFVVSQTYLANSVIILLWTVFIAAVSLYIGIPTIKALKQLMPANVPANDTRYQLILKTQRVLYPCTFSALFLVALDIARLICSWSSNTHPGETFAFLAIIHFICEPLIVASLTYATLPTKSKGVALKETDALSEDETKSTGPVSAEDETKSTKKGQSPIEEIV